MTTDLEADLTAMFSARAAQLDVPPVPAALLTRTADEDAPSHAPRRAGLRSRTFLSLAAAAAVIAIGVPVGITLTGDDDTAAPPETPSTPAVSPDTAPTLAPTAPYLRDQLLHVGELTVPTSADRIVAGGGSVLVAGVTGEGGVAWQRLDGDQLVDVGALAGATQVEVSSDGTLVAGAVASPDDNGSTLLVVDAGGALVETIPVPNSNLDEEQWLWGFDETGRLHWLDGSTVKARMPSGQIVSVDTGDRVALSVVPGGLLLRDGDAPVSAVVKVSADGTVTDIAEIPVSNAAAWRDAETFAYVSLDDGGIRVADLAADTDRALEFDAPNTGRASYQPIGWSNGELVVSGYDTSGRTSVLLVNVSDGSTRQVFEASPGTAVSFPPTRGTGAM